MKTLSERLKYALNKKGLKQADLARAANVSTAAASKWINGDIKNLRGTHLVVIAGLLDVPVGWLADGAEEDTEQKIVLPFKQITIDDLLLFPTDYLEDIEDFIIMKKQKFLKSLNETEISKKLA